MAKSSPTIETNYFDKVFRKFVANGDGKISITELGSATPEHELKDVMSDIDTDREGFIDLEEFIEFQRHGCNASDGAAVNKELREAFDLYDLNKNGKISADELHSVLKMLGVKCSLKECQKMMSK
ncbi:hypothetical protein E3N88_33038 [Mikania micrantha]|uniref:EF-hand domain-containing protein n=1 Tax=Mikania micrantha TaxID=192012 RepID=A0A5N6MCS9_9ASTR|nr:hypothetical protein E3N88_33038 [Mikania micrantha]